jgi:hypothetical protein
MTSRQIEEKLKWGNFGNFAIVASYGELIIGVVVFMPQVLFG